MKATVIQCKEIVIGSGIFLLSFRLPEPMEAEPGQFVTFRPLSIMPRPFSIYSISTIGDRISIMFKVVGPNTRAYSKLVPNDQIEVFGPLGNPIPLDPAVENYILVSGGIGTAGLKLKAERLRKSDKTVRFLLGFKKPNQVFGVKELQDISCEVQVITQEGAETTGMVTDLLRQTLEGDQTESTIVACGPVVMLQKVADMAARNGNKCWVMLEKTMACGVGSCMGCSVFFKDGTVKYVCKHGPTFDASLIDWTKLISRYEITPLFTPPKKLAGKPMEVTLTSPDGKRKITFASPLVTDSGCTWIEALEDDSVSIAKAGAVITKGIRIKPRLGNKNPRVYEVEAGMINAIGLAGEGLERFIAEYLSRWLALGPLVIANIAGNTVDEYVEIAKRLVSAGIVAGEVNVSCPNVEAGCAFGINPKLASEVVQAVRKAVRDMFLIVKLTPAAGNEGIIEVARAVVEAGADALSLTNTFPGLAVDINSRLPKLGNGSGGVSGPAIREQANKMIYDVFQANLGVGIIGYGGVGGGNDENDVGKSAMEKILCGANLVGIGTNLFKEHNAVPNALDFLLEMLKYHGVSHIKELVGQVIL